jgi:hypothetical protein
LTVHDLGISAARTLSSLPRVFGDVHRLELMRVTQDSTIISQISVSDFDRELLKHLPMCQLCRQSSNLSPFLRHPLTPLDPAPTSSPRYFLIRNKKQ